MILIDLSGLLVTKTMYLFDNKYNDEPCDEMDFKVAAINAIVAMNKKFRDKYGQLVICADYPPYWRKDIFEHYKGDRKRDPSSGIDWVLYFKYLSNFLRDCNDILPFMMLHVESAEADDCIFSMAKMASAINQKTIIVSEDRDLLQCQTWAVGVIEQYTIRSKKMISVESEGYDIYKHIVKAGDDGMPNIYSDPDTLVTKGKRQVVMSKKKLAELYDNKYNLKEFLQPNHYANYLRNRTLVDANYMPTDLNKSILEAYRYEKYNKIPLTEYKNFCIKHRSSKLLDLIDDMKSTH